MTSGPIQISLLLTQDSGWSLTLAGKGRQTLQEALQAVLALETTQESIPSQNVSKAVLRSRKARGSTRDRPATAEDRARVDRLTAIVNNLGSGPWSAAALASCLGLESAKQLRIYTNSMYRVCKASGEKPLLEPCKVQGAAGWKRSSEISS